MINPTVTRWVTSTYCEGLSECVETAELPTGARGLRDSKNPGGPELAFDPAVWSAFVAGVKTDAFVA